MITDPPTTGSAPASRSGGRSRSRGGKQTRTGKPDGALTGRLTVVAGDASETEAGPPPTPPGLEPVPGSLGWSYLPDGGPIWRASRQGLQQVLGWSPRVAERLVVLGDTGRPAGRYYAVQVGEDTLTVAHTDLVTGEAWGWFPDAIGTGVTATRHALVSIVEAEAVKRPRTRVVDRTGWHACPDGGRVYVHADGRTYPPDGDLRVVGMPERLAQAALPPSRPASDEELRAALATVHTVGVPLLLSIGAAARSLGYSLCPALVSLVLVGEPGSGKTATVDVGRALSFSGGWPPVPTASFADTLTAIERHVNREADVLVLLDDLALAGDASEVEQREANGKLERVLRAAGNGTAMRDRSTRDLTDRPGSYARGIVAVTAQRLPTTMQPSLYRRLVVVPMARGEVDTAWLRTHGAELKAPLRTLGDRIIARLQVAGEHAGELLAELDGAAAHLLGAHLDRVLPGRTDLVHGMALLAAHLIAGLLLVADTAGLDRGELAAPAVERLAEALAAQVARMADREAATEDLAEAVGEIVREALFAQRAHIRDQAGAISPTVVPGREPQAQGISERADGEWTGRGPALYWLDKHGGLGVRTEDLFLLLRASRDPRVRGLGRGSLAAVLLKAGALVPTTQKGKLASHQVKVAGERLRLILLRPGVVFPDDDPGDSPIGPLSPAGGTGGTGGTVQLNRLPADSLPQTPEVEDSALTRDVPPVPPVPPDFDWVFKGEPVGACSVCDEPCHTLGPDARPTHPLCWDRPPNAAQATVGGALGDVTAWQAQWQTPQQPTAGESGAVGEDQDVSATVAPAAGVPRVPAILDAAGLHLPDGRVLAVEDRSTGAAIAAAAAAAGARDVWLHPQVTRALGLVPARLQAQAAGSPFLASAGEWRAQQDRLTGMVVYRHGQQREVTRLHLVAPGSRLDSLAGARDGTELLRLVRRFEALVGARWDGTASQTTAHLRRALARGNKGMSPGAYHPVEELPEPLRRGVVRAPSWYRPLTAEQAERYPHVVLVDQRANYLAVLDSELGAKAPRHIAPGDHSSLPKSGWAQVRAGAWPDPDTFDPLAPLRRAADDTGAFWAELHLLRYAVGAGVQVEVLEAWGFDASRRFLAPVKARLREALYALEAGPPAEREALRPLVKAMYSEFVGWLGSAEYHQPGDVLWRPDWHDAILSNAAVVTHRKARKAPGRVVAVRTDALGVLLERDDPAQAAALLGGQLGQRLGQFKPEGAWPSALHVLEPDAASDPEDATVEIRRCVRDWQQQGGGRAGAG
jgi:hypothetical protein